jgi:hypothetical protein
VAYNVNQDPARSRLTTFFRLIITIPWFIVVAIWGIAIFFSVIAAWFAIVFTGRYPEGLYNFNAGFLRALTRVNGFAFLAADPLPPFDGGEHPEYPIVTTIPPPLPEYNRVKTLFRIILFIPVYVIQYLLTIVVEVVAILSWIVIVITGKQPDGLQNTLVFGLRYQARASSYGMLLTEQFPGIGEDSPTTTQQEFAPPAPPPPAAPEAPAPTATPAPPADAPEAPPTSES